MTELILDVRLDGFDKPVGFLARDAGGALGFAYSKAFLSDQNAYSISLSLPLTDEGFGDTIVRPFFDNLLQERDGILEDVMARENVARNDIAGLLFYVGKDCAGALSILPLNAPPVKVPGSFDTDYTPLSADRLAEIVTALFERRRLPDNLADPSPLAGVQSKIALTLLPSGDLAEPKRGVGAPTTHILKVPDRLHPRDPIYEHSALELSAKAGFQTADAVVMRIAGIETLLVKRFDRAINNDGQVTRLHQEDFAQALGLPSQLKYERRGTSGRRFDAACIRSILDAMVDPASERIRFIKATLFDLMIGNADAHAKNHAILYQAGGRPVIAPRYDLLPTRLDESFTDELPYNIGNASRLNEITAAEFDYFLQIIGFSSPAARRRQTANASIVANSLAQSFEALTKRGLRNFADLIAANMRQLLPELNLVVPAPALERDAFIPSGGGWLSS